MKRPTSNFVQSALELDEIFTSLEQISSSLETLEPDSEANLERAKKLLMRFTEKSQGLQGGLETLLRSLDDRRRSVEAAVALVNDLAPLVGEKFRQAEEKLERLQGLADQVKELTGEARTLGPAEVRIRLQELTDEATALQEEARAGKLRSLERGASSLRSSLKDLSRKMMA